MSKHPLSQLKLQPMIYLDNNATTIMPVVVKKAMLEWCNRGNPSSGYVSAGEARNMMSEFREYIGNLCGFNPCCREDRDSAKDLSRERQNPALYKIIFTSGASEANCMALHCVVQAYAEITENLPHIIMSAIEHKSLFAMAESYETRGIATVTFITPSLSGHISPADVEAAITPSTCIICVMHANNETGAINDVRKIGALAHKNNIPFHCDTVQTFGKFPISPIKYNVDSFCISFHKLHGPPGIGALVIKQQLLTGYKVSPMIFGTQNEGLRGGTENLPGIGASFAATKYNMENRIAKNEQILKLKTYIMREISTRMPTRTYASYVANTHRAKKPEIEIIFISGTTDFYTPNTILLSIVKLSKPAVCNEKIKTELAENGFVISVGSACNTSSRKASHVLFAMNADDFIRKGALRISLGDDTTQEDAKKFVQTFLLTIKKHTM